MNTTTTPRVYVASLTDYNAGILHGCWVDFTGDAHMEVAAMLAASPTAKREGQPAEEYAIHDHEGFPKGLVQEFSDLDALADWAEFMEETDNPDLIQAAMDCTGYGWADLDEIKSAIEDDFFGSFDDLESWAMEQYEEAYGSIDKLPSMIRYSIDWEAAGSDMLQDYSHSEIKGTTYLFRV